MPKDIKLQTRTTEFLWRKKTGCRLAQSISGGNEQTIQGRKNNTTALSRRAAGASPRLLGIATHRDGLAARVKKLVLGGEVVICRVHTRDHQPAVRLRAQPPPQDGFGAVPRQGLPPKRLGGRGCRRNRDQKFDGEQDINARGMAALVRAGGDFLRFRPLKVPPDEMSGL